VSLDPGNREIAGIAGHLDSSLGVIDMHTQHMAMMIAAASGLILISATY
jgi:hypothetical protein